MEVIDRSIAHQSRIVLIIGTATECIMQSRIRPTFINEEVLADSMCTVMKENKSNLRAHVRLKWFCVMISTLYMKTSGSNFFKHPELKGGDGRPP